VGEGHDSQLLKGVLSLVLLRLLAESESYGYELVLRVHEIGLTDVQDGSVYPALARLEREGSITSRLVPSGLGAARKYYRLSTDGYSALRRLESAWMTLDQALQRLQARPMSPEAREASA
jgi:PadR family transcriptional regulator PadR